MFLTKIKNTALVLVGLCLFSLSLAMVPSGAAERADGRTPAAFGDKKPGAAADVKQVAAQEKPQIDRQTSAANLKNIAIAFHNYHDQHGALPAAAIFDGAGKPLLSWRVALLPYLEQKALYDEFKLDEPWDSAHNKKLLAKMPAVFGPKGDKTVYQVFAGEGTVFEGKDGVRLTDITDGTSNTVLTAEAAAAVPWTKPADLKFEAGKPLPKLGGLFEEGFHIGLADGSVRFVAAKFNEDTMKALITRAGAEVINFDDLNKN